MEAYLAALGDWLAPPPRLRRERLLCMDPRDWGWPVSWVEVVLAAAVMQVLGPLVHVPERPLDAAVDVAGELLGRGGRGVSFTALQAARSC